MLTDEGLTYLARRDRAAVGLTLDRWRNNDYHGIHFNDVGPLVRADEPLHMLTDEGLTLPSLST